MLPSSGQERLEVDNIPKNKMKVRMTFAVRSVTVLMNMSICATFLQMCTLFLVCGNTFYKGIINQFSPGEHLEFHFK